MYMYMCVCARLCVLNMFDVKNHEEHWGPSAGHQAIPSVMRWMPKRTPKILADPFLALDSYTEWPWPRHDVYAIGATPQGVWHVWHIWPSGGKGAAAGNSGKSRMLQLICRWWLICWWVPQITETGIITSALLCRFGPHRASRSTEDFLIPAVKFPGPCTEVTKSGTLAADLGISRAENEDWAKLDSWVVALQCWDMSRSPFSLRVSKIIIDHLWTQYVPLTFNRPMNKLSGWTAWWSRYSGDPWGISWLYSSNYRCIYPLVMSK